LVNREEAAKRLAPVQAHFTGLERSLFSYSLPFSYL